MTTRELSDREAADELSTWLRNRIGEIQNFHPSSAEGEVAKQEAIKESQRDLDRIDAA
jgi:hypothetical protein